MGIVCSSSSILLLQERMKNGVRLDPKQQMGDDGRQRMPPAVIELMEKCVSFEARDRPTMKEIHETLEVMLDELKGRSRSRKPQPSQPVNGNIEEKMDGVMVLIKEMYEHFMVSYVVCFFWMILFVLMADAHVDIVDCIAEQYTNSQATIGGAAFIATGEFKVMKTNKR